MRNHVNVSPCNRMTPLPAVLAAASPQCLAPFNGRRCELHVRVLGGDASTRIYLDGVSAAGLGVWPLLSGETYVLPLCGEVWVRLGAGAAATVHAVEYTMSDQVGEEAQA